LALQQQSFCKSTVCITFSVHAAVVVVKVSNGALDMAKANMELLLSHCAKPLSLADAELTTAQSKSMFDTVHELVRHVTSPNTVVRDQVSFSISYSVLI